MCSALALSFVTQVCNAADGTVGKQVPQEQSSEGYWGGWANPLNWFSGSGAPIAQQIQAALTEALESGDPDALADAVDHVSALRFTAGENGDTAKVAELDAAIKANEGLITTCLKQEVENKAKDGEDDAPPPLIEVTAAQPKVSPRTLTATTHATKKEDEAVKLAQELQDLKLQVINLSKALSERGKQVVQEAAEDDSRERSGLRGLFEEEDTAPTVKAAVQEPKRLTKAQRRAAKSGKNRH